MAVFRLDSGAQGKADPFLSGQLRGRGAPVRTGGMPQQGGGVELTRVWLGEVPWWTVGIEVFGTEKLHEEGLGRIASLVFSSDGTLNLSAETCASYPSWLSRSNLRP